MIPDCTTQELVERYNRALDTINSQRREIVTLKNTLSELVGAISIEVNEKGGGGYLLARLTDAKGVLKSIT